MAEPSYIRPAAPSEEDILRKVRRDALRGLIRLGAPPDSTPSVSPEIVPGIYWDDIDILLARRQQNRRPRRVYGGEEVDLRRNS